MAQSLQVYREGRQMEVDDHHPLPVVESKWVVWVPYAFETLTVATVGLPLTHATYQDPFGDTPPDRAEIGPVEAGACRYRYDGPDPTASVGHLLDVGVQLVLEGPDAIQKFRIIRQGSVSASIPVTYLRKVQR